MIFVIACSFLKRGISEFQNKNGIAENQGKYTATGFGLNKSTLYLLYIIYPASRSLYCLVRLYCRAPHQRNWLSQSARCDNPVCRAAVRPLPVLTRTLRAKFLSHEAAQGVALLTMKTQRIKAAKEAY
ncbi:MAG: hypothetical protein D6814_05705 [Calditrichaeota bacterium]|nr:MAG: hypothetical protein D6814_05705 [Calditrichota bacterium]